jgi:MarR family transcriptional regulator for hemolysin
MKNIIENIPLFLIDQTSKLAKQHSQKEFDSAKLGITVDQWVLLKILDENPNISQTILANKSLRDPASITRTLDLLQKKELVLREAISDDRRQFNINLSTNGKKFVAEHMPMISKLRLQSISGLSKSELDNLRTILLKIQNNMR